MKRSSTLLLLICTVGTAISQCNVTIPPDVTVVSTLQEGSITTTNGEVYWVCPGIDVSVEGNNNFIYIEPVGSGNVIGNNNTIVTQGGTFFIPGNNNIIYTIDPATVVETGLNNEVIHCPEIVFNYDDAPAGGCELPTTMEEGSDIGAIVPYPNPMADILNIPVGNGPIISNVRIVDMQGRVVAEQAGPVAGTIDVSTLSPGLFLVIMDSGSHQRIHKMRKE